MAAAISEGATGWLAKRVSPDQGVVEIALYTANTVDSDDTIAVDLAGYGINTFVAIFGCAHSTDGNSVITEAPTTSVSGTTLTITLGGSSNDDDPRCFIIWGLANGVSWGSLT